MTNQQAHELLIRNGYPFIDGYYCYAMPLGRKPSEELIQACTHLFEQKTCVGFISYLYMEATETLIYGRGGVAGTRIESRGAPIRAVIRKVSSGVDARVKLPCLSYSVSRCNSGPRLP